MTKRGKMAHPGGNGGMELPPVSSLDNPPFFKKISASFNQTGGNQLM
ncbi:MAG: hypothetical protein NQU46_05765 [Methanolinea sp.]|nr:hypothetical protein [Methanolinea sp.]